jgi:uncharacterized protein (DUF1499 family)
VARLGVVLATLGFWLAVACAIAAIASPVGYRLGWWDFRVALLTIVKWATIGGAVAFVISLLAAFLSRGAGRGYVNEAIAGMIVSAIFAGFPLFQYNKVQRLPYIHDITTDTENPPSFVALADARKASPNGSAYEGAVVAAQQKQHYPDIAPLISKVSPGELFTKAGVAARELGWQVAAAEVSDHRIEATQTSLIYGFKDDIVIRITPNNGGSKLDIRSMSRVGRSDVGVNAKRIRDFVAQLRAAGA